MKHYVKWLFEMQNTIDEAMVQITDLLHSNNISFTFIGGITLPFYGYGRTTTDIDALIEIEDKEKFEDLIGTYFSPKFPGAKKKFKHNATGTQFEVIYSGEGAGNDKDGIKYKSPNLVSNIIDDLSILTLKDLIAYKLSAGMYAKEGRLKDFGDVQELIRINGLPFDYLKDQRQDITNKYVEIWNETKEEV